jgi:hypothetical protein
MGIRITPSINPIGIKIQNITSSVFSNSNWSSILGGGGHDVPFVGWNPPTQYLVEYVNRAYSDNGVMRYFYSQLFSEYIPDITGYTLLFVIPPHLSGYENTGNANYTQGNDGGFMDYVGKMAPVLATSFSPPQLQMASSAISGTSGSQQYASELQVTDNLSVSYMETNNLDVYAFHRTWVNYIFEIMEGNLSPDEYYIENKIIDYCASFYFVKFRQDFEYITYIGKAIGCFPKELPSMDIIGNRASNELTTVNFNYVVSDFQEVTFREGNNDSHWLVQELADFVLSRYDGGSYSSTGRSSLLQSTSFGNIGRGLSTVGNVVKDLF